ncbi:MAG: HAD family hydrolase [Kiritimatiellia bacterium]|jgi:phosphoglycolate phosphatase-like HAD superfamily hydrolase|nr:HAD family hydrolase [Kiritimatiellia bacterium]MDP6631817.1 HAD family hydrolase [Kiritimatiellia bacterium]MDP6811487.1 HAD family hydrolase [Kiritimatiellia bacterium]MDP7023429.1 HAD family hydrolase [Kiritimatiellia bacterium]
MSTTTYTKEALIGFRPQHDFFVGVDSDGCVFDTMEIKQKQCFHGLIAKMWDLISIEPLLRETAEFVNLYSQSRGSNRFPALLKTMDLLRTRSEVRASETVVPEMNGLRSWIAEESQLGMPALEAKVHSAGDADLAKVLDWSHAVNREVETTVKQVPPFKWVRECLHKMGALADIVVVSQTPTDALVREWKVNDMMDSTAFIAGQELGTKTEHIAMATRDRYPPSHILMIGDAPGDCHAAKANGAFFFPINPAHEEASWQLLYEEAFDTFITGAYGGDYERHLIERFDALLPEGPPWER